MLCLHRLHIDALACSPGENKLTNKMLGHRALSKLNQSKQVPKELETYIVTLTIAHYLHRGSRENTILGVVAFAVYLAIFIVTKPSLCAIGAVPKRTIEVGHGAGCTDLPWEATFLELGESCGRSAVLSRGRICGHNEKVDGTNIDTQHKRVPIDLLWLSRPRA